MMTKPTILVAEDDDSVRLVISQTLTADGYAVRATSSVDALKRWVREGEGDAIVTDVYLGDESIFDSMQMIQLERPDLPIIVMSGQNTILTAATAAEQGAFDYIPKPFDIENLSSLVSRALKKMPAGAKRVDRITRDAERNASLPLIGRSAIMQDVYRVVSRVMNTDLPILIEGEPGSGKELTAQAVHDLSQHSNTPFIRLNLEGIDSQEANEVIKVLPDSDKYTLYIDEISSLSLEVQARLGNLLRDTKGARIIASTSQNLEDKIEGGTFRQDLYYRLNIVRLVIPPLRDRSEDIPELATAFLIKAKERGLPEKRLNTSGLDILSAHNWPGNVRELENIILRLCALSPDPLISAADIKNAIHKDMTRLVESDENMGHEIDRVLSKFVLPQLIGAKADEGNNIYHSTIAEIERSLILMALEVTAGNKVKAAALLGLNRNTLRSKINLLKLSDE